MVPAFALVIAAGLWIAQSHAQQPDIGTPSQRTPLARELPPRNVPLTVPKGSAAIIPHTGGVPSFSLDDAKQYVATHAPSLGVLGRNKPNVTRAEFLTSRQVSERLHGVTTGFAPDHPLCYVELQGPFSFTGPQGAIVTYSRGVLIFDAQTGNLVISGGMP